METDGQSSDSVRWQENEPQELSPIHTGHLTRNVPATAQNLQELRGTAGVPQRERVLQVIHRESDGQVQADHTAI